MDSKVDACDTLHGKRESDAELETREIRHTFQYHRARNVRRNLVMPVLKDERSKTRVRTSDEIFTLVPFMFKRLTFEHGKSVL